MRSSTANSIAAATEHWPNTFTATLNSLKELYRAKAIFLAPEFDQYVSLPDLARTDVLTAFIGYSHISER